MKRFEEFIDMLLDMISKGIVGALLLALFVGVPGFFLYAIIFVDWRFIFPVLFLAIPWAISRVSGPVVWKR